MTQLKDLVEEELSLKDLIAEKRYNAKIRKDNAV
jgi:hypothetical protein